MWLQKRNEQPRNQQCRAMTGFVHVYAGRANDATIDNGNTVAQHKLMKLAHACVSQNTSALY